MHFAIKEWIDGAVVFDLRSGDTHALDVLSAELLKQSSQFAPQPDPREAAALIAERFGVTVDQELVAATDAALDSLRQLRLL